MTDDLRFTILMPSRGEDLARQLLKAASHALDEQQQLFVSEVARLLYHLSPTQGRQRPKAEVIAKAERTAKQLQTKISQTQVVRPESQILLMRARKLLDAIVAALAMATATVPDTVAEERLSRTLRDRFGIPFVRDRDAAQHWYLHARELLAPLQLR